MKLYKCKKSTCTRKIDLWEYEFWFGANDPNVIKLKAETKELEQERLSRDKYRFILFQKEGETDQEFEERQERYADYLEKATGVSARNPFYVSKPTEQQ